MKVYVVIHVEQWEEGVPDEILGVFASRGGAEAFVEAEAKAILSNHWQSVGRGYPIEEHEVRA